MDTALPVDLSAGHRRSPWLLSALDVNALNFCGFAMCEDRADSNTPETWEKNLLIAVPSALNSDSVYIRISSYDGLFRQLMEIIYI